MRVLTRQSYEPSAVPRADVAVLFDVFRASTTLATLLTRRPAGVVATNDEAEARRLVAAGHVLVSEVFRGGMDNSPTRILEADLEGRHVVHKSTNLTTALFPLVARASRVMIGGFVNVSRLVALIEASGAATVELVAAGHCRDAWEAVEDTAAVSLVAAWLAGDRRREVPRMDAIQAYLDDRRRRRPDGPAHYWDDVAFALTIDRLSTVVEAKARRDVLIDMVECR